MRTSFFALSFVLLLSACGGGGGSGSAQPPANVASGPTTTPTPNPATPPTPAFNKTIIDVLALMSPGVDDQYNDADLRLQHLFNTANNVAEDSGADVQFVMRHLEVVSYPDTISAPDALNDLTNGSHPSLANIANLRTDYEADLVVLFRPYANDGHCGYAWIGGYLREGDFSHPSEADYGYSVVAANCSDYTLLHELGHNLGLAHSRREDPEGGTHTYALGHGEDNDFVTIMASPTLFNATQLPYLSSPSLICNGTPCGVAHTEGDGADAVRVLNLTAPQVANYR